MHLPRDIWRGDFPFSRRLRLFLRGAIVGGLLASTSAQALALVGVQSRKLHGAQGEFNLRIDSAQPITAAITVEPRVLGSGYNVVFQFDGPVNSVGTVSVIDELFAPVFSFTTTTSNNEVIVGLTEVADNKRLTVSLRDVNGVAGLNASASIGFLIGDVSQSGLISASDISAAKARLNVPVTLTNFWFDINLSGAIDSADLAMIKSKAGRKLINVPTVNGMFVPPDPGDTAYATTVGVDLNANGVRDEVERALAGSYGSIGANFDAAMIVARTAQTWLTQPVLSELQAQSMVLDEIQNYRCLAQKVGADLARQMAQEIELRTFSTTARRLARRAILDKAGTFEVLPASIPC